MPVSVRFSLEDFQYVSNSPFTLAYNAEYPFKDWYSKPTFFNALSTKIDEYGTG